MDTDWPAPKKPAEHDCTCQSWCGDRPCNCRVRPKVIVCEDCHELGIFVDNRAEEGYRYCWLCIQAKKIELKEKRQQAHWWAKLWQEPVHEAMEIFFNDIKLRRPAEIPIERYVRELVYGKRERK